MLESSLAVGVDMIAVQDVAASIARFGERYVERLFTVSEIDYCRRDPELTVARFAGRFAAKEAAMKVLRPRPADLLTWQSIEVQSSESGWCEVVLHNGAAALAAREGVAGLALSISHERDYAIATVIGTRTRVLENPPIPR